MLRFEHAKMENNLAFGLAFKRLRLLKGMTQEDFSSVVSERYIRMLERGQYSPSLSTIVGLADVLGIGAVSLVALVEAESAGEEATVVAREALVELMELVQTLGPL
ncbi:helix-turn-helix domain-containing protein [Pseudomonas sp. 22373]|uniref:helix-turn-helix domain-containing protein n=1 Tax=Pseudomonas TaxID=286 RepID=UPI0009EE9392|nr:MULTISPECIES: helix-turn-helix transcriptional regulator [Pseudomonas]MDD2077022.1 helix-turn-helix transcriptional regulator [Pseudomonas putida]QKL04062.1 helix-turn-helix domain-containing protein [Pseudomonas sp. NY5710]QNT40643.1 helix-turn-helix transcriptional regulator [Pseudomonas asiatica]HDS1693555.1 helix-turn-helix transcriptional regulator [Pseudomonas putida]